MVYVLILILCFTVCMTVICSLAEASLYSVPYSHVKHLAETGSLRGQALLRLKENVSKPISAILILNTLALTVGPTFAGAIASDLFSETGLFIFSMILGLIILYVGEITPKITGALYARQVSLMLALPLEAAVKFFVPLIWISDKIARKLSPSEDTPSVSHHEVLSMTAIGTEEGALDHFEGSVITNVIGLDQLLVRDVLTPRINVFRAEEERTIEDLMRDELITWGFTRVPLYNKNDPDILTGYVVQRDIHHEILRGHMNRTLKAISRRLKTVPELMRVDELLFQMFDQKEQICGVVDEHGGLAGIITLEDIIEEVVGREIVDEYDQFGVHGEEGYTPDKVQRFARNREKKIKAFVERKKVVGPVQ